MSYTCNQPLVLVERNRKVGTGFQVRMISEQKQGLFDEQPFTYENAVLYGTQMLEQYNNELGTHWSTIDCLRVTLDGIRYNRDEDSDCVEVLGQVAKGEVKLERGVPILFYGSIPTEDCVEKVDDAGEIQVTYTRRGWLQMLMFAHIDGFNPTLTRNILAALFKIALIRKGDTETKPEDMLKEAEGGTVKDALAYVRKLYDEA